MSIVIVVTVALVSLMMGGTLGVFLGAALGGRRRHELETTLAWYEHLQAVSQAPVEPRAEPVTDRQVQIERGA